MSDDFQFEEPTAGQESEDPKITTLDTGEPDYTEEELDAVFDALMFEGAYIEEVQVHKKLKVTFRTRSGAEGREVLMKVDTARANLGYTLESLRSVYNLCYSVAMFNGKDLTSVPFDKRLEMLEKLPSPVLGLLIRKLVIFDMKVERAIEAGSGNF